ncbi:MAG: GntR family transcriptional regulator [Rhodobacteraceae bacterium]|nr:MAG: GntR family transcriptional regulator [Paracoccaceae bacterium]
MSKQSRTLQTYQALKFDVLSARYLPGRKLIIENICEEQCVSPGAVREALARLTSDGLVIAEPQKGFTVAPVSIADLQDLTEVRIDVEQKCIRRAIRDGDIEWEGQILSTLHQLNKTLETTVLEGGKLVFCPIWAEKHAQFHDALVSACSNLWWLNLRSRLFMQAERYRWMTLPYVEEKRFVVKEHEALVAATLDRDADLASALVEDHLQKTADLLLSSDAPFDDTDERYTKAVKLT